MMIEKLNTLFPYLFFFSVHAFALSNVAFQTFISVSFFYIRTGWVNTFDLIYYTAFFTVRSVFVYIRALYSLLYIYMCRYTGS